MCTINHMTRLKYSEIEKSTRSPSWTCYLNNKVATLLVDLVQDLPIHANQITTASFIFVILAITLLLIFNNAALFILSLFVSFTLDNMDGIWARIKGQASSFGKFYDHYLDMIKDCLIDTSLIIYFNRLVVMLVSKQELFLILSFIYIISKTMYWVIRDYTTKKLRNNKDMTAFTLGGAEKYIILYPLCSLFYPFFLVFISSYFLLYVTNITTLLIQKLKASK